MMQRLGFRAMGCQMLAVVDSDSPQVLDELRQIPNWFARWEKQLSRFRDDSELAQLNRKAGTWMAVSAELWDVLQLAMRAVRESGGLVTPTLLGALEQAGYDRSFERIGEIGARGMQAALEANTDWRAIQFDFRSRSIRLPIGMRLDLGGIAKGWAADRAAGKLSASGPALVDAGGDIAVSSPLRDGSPWPIGVADPAAPDRQFDLLLLPGGGVATSGRDYRCWQQNGAWQHHILDPRTGQPAKTDVISATIIAPTTYEAEVAAKTALILGSRAGLAWLEDRPSLAGLLVLENGKVLRSRRFNDYTWS